MEKELAELLEKYSYEEIVQAINSLSRKGEDDANGEKLVFS
ncbi:hypothetical protein [Clostridium sp.]|nr:hypothetical protein [Clostridium sp.]MDU3526585.1 hypothetical protein [Clostridium sp.]